MKDGRAATAMPPCVGVCIKTESGFASNATSGRGARRLADDDVDDVLDPDVRFAVAMGSYIHCSGGSSSSSSSSPPPPPPPSLKEPLKFGFKTLFEECEALSVDVELIVLFTLLPVVVAIEPICCSAITSSKYGGAATLRVVFTQKLSFTQKLKFIRTQFISYSLFSSSDVMSPLAPASILLPPRRNVP
ncbi:hypothetical protein FF38_00835 [Lucilia cuprina]|uniref:Uncharacterized protein n=1 Tax=Lucilia cuprina TaxID=7375 RepID=A0A0L0CD93_LUCCU|nr:hypothetical protein FF38_00835 [Lucilia cuprina]